MHESAAKSLGEKLARLDLTEDEGAILITLLGGTVESEVSGFGSTPSFGTLMPLVRQGYGHSEYFIADSFGFGIEREMKE